MTGKPGDLWPGPKATRPRCGARRKSDGQPCQAPARWPSGRCRLHGGLSTGPKTAEGRARALANLRQFRDPVP